MQEIGIGRKCCTRLGGAFNPEAGSFGFPEVVLFWGRVSRGWHRHAGPWHVCERQRRRTPGKAAPLLGTESPADVKKRCLRHPASQLENLLYLR